MMSLDFQTAVERAQTALDAYFTAPAPGLVRLLTELGQSNLFHMG